MSATIKLIKERQNLNAGHYKFLKFIMLAVMLSTSLLVITEVGAKKLTPKAFVYTEVQNSVPFNQVPWKKVNSIISEQPGFMYKTWFSGFGNHSVGGFYAFDSIENAQKYVTEFFPNQARKQGTGHTTRVFDAVIVEEASRDIGSVDFDGEISTTPKAFVYTELQVNIPFEKVQWKKRNPIIKTEQGLLSKTWLSGVNTNTVGGIYAFDTIENAKHFALESFPETAKKMNAALYIRIFDAKTVESASREMYSPFFYPQAELLENKSGSIRLGGESLESIVIQKPALYPEGIDYNPNTDKFIVGSFREGAVYEVNLDGTYRQLIDDNRLNSVLAVRVDVKRNRLLVVNSDIGASVRPSSEGAKKTAFLGIYELSSGKAIHFIDLGKLLPNQNHLANGMALDSDGNAYVTDSFSPVIYKIDVKSNASIFLENDRFLGEGINLNGIVFHPDGYLIVVKKGEGVLFKVPLNNPKDFSEIKVPRKFIGGDGLILANNKELIVIANRASGEVTETAFALSSEDDWKTAKVINEYKLGAVYPTTGVVRKGNIYVLHSNLQALMLASKEEKSQLQKMATIQQIGSVKN
jgi:sugar lactone lactonase YvrE